MFIRPQNIIVIGGIAAGPAAAARTKRFSLESNVIMFEAEEFISTGTCELPYVLSNQIKNWQEMIFFDQSTFEKEKAVKVYTNHFVKKIDRRKKTITVVNKITNQKSEQIYDMLILSTGSLPKQIPLLPRYLKNVFTLKNVKDYLLIRKFLDENYVRKILVVGAGYIGLEAAESFHHLVYEVALLEKENLPMPSADFEVRQQIREILVKNNIDFFGDATYVKFNVSGEKSKFDLL